jgi:hypothetical protein
MPLTCFDALNYIKTPVWLISPVSEHILFANTAATDVMRNKTVNEMRTGIYSANAQSALSMYVPDLKTDQEIIEIWTVWRNEQESTLTCRLTLTQCEPHGDVIIFEGIAQQTTSGLKASRSATYQRKKQGFYARFF